MQIVQENAEGLRREFKITVPAGEIEAKVTDKLGEMSKQVHMRGFRPGKVPVTLLRKMYGKSVLGEVLQETVNATSEQALKDNQLVPAMQPKIEITQFDDGTDLEYKMAVEIMPEFEPIDLSKLELTRLTAIVEAAKVDEALANIAAQQRTFEPITGKRKSKKGDMTVIDFVGKIDGEPFEGGSATDFRLELGSDRFIPGFEDQLIGAKAGEAVNVKLTFPADYPQPEVAGKEAVFEVSVKEIREPQDVAIDEDLAKRLGLDNLEALRNAVKGQIEKDYAGYSRLRLKRSLLDALAAEHDFAVPPGMVDMEFDQIARQLGETEGAAAETEPKPHDHDHDHEHDHDHDHDHGDAPAAVEPDYTAKLSDDEKAEYQRIAERRVRLGLLLAKVGQLNNIEVTPDEMNRAIMEQARRFPGQERHVMEFYRNNPEMMAQLRAPIFEDKVVDFVLELAKVSEKKVSPEDLMRDPDEEADAGAEAKAAKKSPRRKAKSKPKASKKASAGESGDE